MRGKSKGKRATSTPLHDPEPTEEMISVPLRWFWDKLHQSMKVVVRPPTAKTRRKEVLIKQQVPIEVFYKLLSQFSTGEIEGLVWEATTSGKEIVKPTKSTTRTHVYEYNFKKGVATDKLWRLEETDRPKKNTAFKRGAGSARLHLSDAAGERGVTTNLLAMVCGRVKIKLKQPKRMRFMPTLELTAFVLTMDQAAHIIWPVEFDDVQYRAALRKQAKALLGKMIADPLYPTSSQMQQSVTMAGTASTRPPPPPMRAA